MLQYISPSTYHTDSLNCVQSATIHPETVATAVVFAYLTRTSHQILLAPRRLLFRHDKAVSLTESVFHGFLLLCFQVLPERA